MMLYNNKRKKKGCVAVQEMSPKQKTEETVQVQVTLRNHRTTRHACHWALACHGSPRMAAWAHWLAAGGPR